MPVRVIVFLEAIQDQISSYRKSLQWALHLGAIGIFILVCIGAIIWTVQTQKTILASSLASANQGFIWQTEYTGNQINQLVRALVDHYDSDTSTDSEIKKSSVSIGKDASLLSAKKNGELTLKEATVKVLKLNYDVWGNNLEPQFDLGLLVLNPSGSLVYQSNPKWGVNGNLKPWITERKNWFERSKSRSGSALGGGQRGAWWIYVPKENEIAGEQAGIPILLWVRPIWHTVEKQFPRAIQTTSEPQLIGYMVAASSSQEESGAMQHLLSSLYQSSRIQWTNTTVGFEDPVSWLEGMWDPIKEKWTIAFGKNNPSEDLWSLIPYTEWVNPYGHGTDLVQMMHQSKWWDYPRGYVLFSQTPLHVFRLYSNHTVFQDFNSSNSNQTTQIPKSASDTLKSSASALATEPFNLNYKVVIGQVIGASGILTYIWSMWYFWVALGCILSVYYLMVVVLSVRSHTFWEPIPFVFSKLIHLASLADAKKHELSKTQDFLFTHERHEFQSELWPALKNYLEYVKSSNMNQSQVQSDDVRELRKAASLLNKLSQNIPGFIYVYTRRNESDDGFFEWASEGIKHIYGVSHSDVISSASSVWVKILPHDIEKVSRTIYESFVNLTPWECTYQVRLQDGVHMLRGMATPNKKPDGSVQWYGCILDITEQQSIKHEEAWVVELLHRLSEESEQLALQMVVDKNGQAHVHFVSPHLLRRSGQINWGKKTPYSVLLTGLSAYQNQSLEHFILQLPNPDGTKKIKVHAHASETLGGHTASVQLGAVLSLSAHAQAEGFWVVDVQIQEPHAHTQGVLVEASAAKGGYHKAESVIPVALLERLLRRVPIGVSLLGCHVSGPVLVQMQEVGRFIQPTAIEQWTESLEVFLDKFEPIVGLEGSHAFSNPGHSDDPVHHFVRHISVEACASWGRWIVELGSPDSPLWWQWSDEASATEHRWVAKSDSGGWTLIGCVQKLLVHKKASWERDKLQLMLSVALRNSDSAASLWCWNEQEGVLMPVPGFLHTEHLLNVPNQTIEKTPQLFFNFFDATTAHQLTDWIQSTRSRSSATIKGMLHPYASTPVPCVISLLAVPFGAYEEALLGSDMGQHDPVNWPPAKDLPERSQLGIDESVLDASGSRSLVQGSHTSKMAVLYFIVITKSEIV